MLELPRTLEDLAADDDRAGWISELPALVAEAKDLWSLSLGAPFEPGGTASWVAPGRADGRSVVLKVGWLHNEAVHEPEALRLWNGDGAIQLYDELRRPQAIVMLLERCSPGTALANALPEAEQHSVIAGLLQRLWRTPPGDHGFRPLRQMCVDWADEFEAAAEGVDPGLRRAAVGLLRELPATATSEVVLVTDLHAGNVLMGEREPWLVIDPKPYVGDPTYDVLQHMLNCEERLMTDPRRLIDELAGLLPIDPDRLRLWLFARLAVELVTSPELTSLVRSLAP